MLRNDDSSHRQRAPDIASGSACGGRSRVRVRGAVNVFLGALKQRVKAKLKAARLEYLRRRYAFGVDDFERALRQVGVQTGDTLLIHSSFEKLVGFTGAASDLIKALQATVGAQGTLMMPTLPFSGSAIDYARGLDVFDVRRAPSRMGLLTELFRRTKGVQRSIHPTHPVAAWGAGAEFMIRDHHACSTPCGRHSPYGRLLDCDGKVLLLGTSIRVMTFYHCLEELLEADFPESPFTREEFVLKSRDLQGKIHETTTRLFEPSLSKRRNMLPIEEQLRLRGHWKEQPIGRTSLILLEAAQVLDTVTRMNQKGIFCYHER